MMASDGPTQGTPPPMTPSRRRRRRVGHSHRVLLYTTCYNVIDGVTLTIRKIEQELLAAGHSVLILTTRSGDMRNTNMEGTHRNRQVLFLDNSVPIPFLEDPNNPAVQYHFGYSLSRHTRAKLDEFEASIVHITCPDNLCLLLIQYAREKEIPLMGTYHSNIPDYMHHYPGMCWLKPLLGTFFLHQYGFLQQLYVPTPYIHKYLAEKYNMDKATSLQVWGRGIDLNRFSPSHRSLKFRRGLGIDDDDVVICWVGRCVPEKRTDIFASVVRRLHARGVPFRTLVVGRGPSEDHVRTLPNVAFCGWLDGAHLSVAYASSDIFLFPSSVETFGNVTLEAAASGLPLVVEAGCSGHLVNDGLNGFACTDEESFFQATLKLCVDHELRESCAKASREHSLKFEKGAIVKQMLENYSNVTDEFYCEYGGHHANRDVLYLDQVGAFTAGSHPRPFFFALVEFVIIIAFRVLTWMWSAVPWLLAKAGLSRKHVPEQPTAAMRVVNKSPLTKLSTVVRTDSVTMALIEEGGDHDDETSVTASIVETSSFTSTGSTEHDFQLAGVPPTNTTVSPFAAIGDSAFITGLSERIIGFIAYQCRVESGIRNRVKSIVGERWSGGIRGKRKDSNIAWPPTLVRDRSNGSDCSDGSRHEDTLKRRTRRSPLLNESFLESSP